EHFQTKLGKHVLPKRKRGEPLTPEYVTVLNKRHSAILGLSSLVLAFPYEIPAWMPRILVVLAHCASEPSPVSSSITHTFGEFKRTHQDSWEKDKLRFTSEELYTISDLIYSPGYFA
ncbi:Proteasome activator complex subunit 4, partial [Kappamyces sp. JEL0680]